MNTTSRIAREAPLTFRAIFVSWLYLRTGFNKVEILGPRAAIACIKQECESSPVQPTFRFKYNSDLILLCRQHYGLLGANAKRIKISHK